MYQIFFVAVFSYITGNIAGKIIYKVAKKYSEDNVISFNKSMIKKDVFRRLTLMFPFIIFYFTSEFLFPDTPKFEHVLVRMLSAVVAVLGVYTVNAFIDSIDHYYHEFEVAKKNPIKG